MDLLMVPVGTVALTQHLVVPQEPITHSVIEKLTK